MQSKKCAYESCTCEAMPLDDYCCDTCKDAAVREAEGDKPLDRCHCMHADCGGEPQLEVEPEGMLMPEGAVGA
jgi:hypothetical protein